MSQQTSQKRNSNRLSVVFQINASLLILAGLMCSGCVTMNLQTPPTAEPPTPGGPSYKVIFANNQGGEPQIYTGYLDKPVTIQQALDDSGATAKYEGMLVDIARRVEDSGQILKLQVEFDQKTNRIMERDNYAIHPGDEILVRENNPGPLDAMFRALQGSSYDQR